MNRILSGKENTMNHSLWQREDFCVCEMEAANIFQWVRGKQNVKVWREGQRLFIIIWSNSCLWVDFFWEAHLHIQLPRFSMMVSTLQTSPSHCSSMRSMGMWWSLLCLYCKWDAFPTKSVLVLHPVWAVYKNMYCLHKEPGCLSKCTKAC